MKSFKSQLRAAALAGILLGSFGTVAVASNSVSASQTYPGYIAVSSNGSIAPHNALNFGGLTASPSSGSIVDGTPSPNGLGYWLLNSNGSITAIGNVPNFGSAPAPASGATYVSIQATSDGRGYWALASNGFVANLGDAGYYGSDTGGSNTSVVSMAPTADSRGYWILGSNGQVSSFGDAGFYGAVVSTASGTMVGIAATPDGRGYWIASSTGAVYNFGDAQNDGSLMGSHLSSPIVSIAPSVDHQGYLLVSSSGVVSGFGDAASGGNVTPPSGSTITAIFTTSSNPLPPTGTTGYDISNWQGTVFPQNSALLIPEVVGWDFTAENAYLATQASYGGSNLQLYAFMGNQSSPPGGISLPSCPSGISGANCTGWQLGYAQLQYAYGYANSQGVHAGIWWLDVETSSGAWSSNYAENYNTVLGAISYLRAVGVIAGVYSNTGLWNSVTNGGTIPSGVPIWVASPNYAGSPGSACSGSLTNPFGGVQSIAMVQYAVQSYDEDVVC